MASCRVKKTPTSHRGAKIAALNDCDCPIIEKKMADKMTTKIQDFMSNLRGRSDEVTAHFSGVLRNPIRLTAIVPFGLGWMELVVEGQEVRKVTRKSPYFCSYGTSFIPPMKI